jgi:hypothetical protein
MEASEIITQGGKFFVGVGTLALLNAGLAQSKNRRGLNMVSHFIVFRSYSNIISRTR